MRQRMISALSYPRRRVLGDIDLEECPHHGVFEMSRERCQKCDLRKGCHWLVCLKKGEALCEQSIYTIHATLLFGLSLVETDKKRLRDNNEFIHRIFSAIVALFTRPEVKRTEATTTDCIPNSKSTPTAK